MAKIITAKEAAALIKNGDTVASAGMALMGLCEDVIRATEQRFLENGSPRDLTLIYGAHQGDKPSKEWGWNRWTHEGMLKRYIGGFIGATPGMIDLCMNNKIEAYCLPMGVINQLWPAIAGKTPGLITKIGLRTYVDPRLEGAKMNEVTKEDIVDLVNISGEEWLLYKSMKLNVGLIRGTVADTRGNLSLSEESINGDSLALARAVKNSGGIVIAQTKYLAEAGSLHPRDVHIPGVLIDYLVVCETPEETHLQNEAFYYNPTLCGNVKANLSAIPRIPLNDQKVIARRAAMEISRGDSINLGIGIPQNVASVCVEEGVSDYVTATSESGIVGGVAIVGGAGFGNNYNPECILDQDVQVNWYNGGGLNVAFLGLAESDAHGNVNVSKFGSLVNGPGGFIDITQPTKKVIFCGTMMAGKLKTEVKDGKIHIVQEGRSRKFVESVQQVTFSGDYAVESGQEVLYITERGVFRLTPDGLELIEIAPGIDLDKDIIANMGFRPRISPDLKVMDACLFQEDWGGLKAIMDAKEA